MDGREPYHQAKFSRRVRGAQRHGGSFEPGLRSCFFPMDGLKTIPSGQFFPPGAEGSAPRRQLRAFLNSEKPMDGLKTIPSGIKDRSQACAVWDISQKSLLPDPRYGVVS